MRGKKRVDPDGRGGGGLWGVEKKWNCNHDILDKKKSISNFKMEKIKMSSMLGLFLQWLPIP